MSDHLVRAVCRPLSVRIVAAVTTELSRDAARRHGTSPAVACALSRGLTAGELLATLTRGGERVTIQIACEGPLGGLTVDAYDDGDVRGYPQRPQAFFDRPWTGSERLRDLCGYDGVVNVLRQMGSGATLNRYQGQVRLSTGEIDEDVEAYLRGSEQIPSALGCEAVLRDGQIHAAAGVLAQVLPGGSEDVVRQLQHRLRGGALRELIEGPHGPAADLLPALLPDLEIEVLDRRELRFRCRCDNDRIAAMLGTLPVLDLDEMIAEGQAEITCNYCSQVYHVDAAELQRVRDDKAPRQSN